MKSKVLSLAYIMTRRIGQSSGEEGIASRKRSNLLDSIRNYIPRSEVMAAAVVDLDVRAIKKELEKQNEEGWVNAEALYRQGAFSKPVATIALKGALRDSVPLGTPVSGVAVDGFEVSGKTFEETAANETSIRIEYDIDSNIVMEVDHTHCSVGGNPTPIVGGCLEPEGNITIDTQTYPYSYDVLDSNSNFRTIADLNAHTEQQFWTCSHCPFPEFRKYYNYYGEFDYADRIIGKAFRGERMDLDNGNMDFGYYSKYGRKKFIYKAMTYMSIWMYTIRQMEQAIAECKKGDFLQAVDFWDEAVALYTGSRGTRPGNNGELIFHQAELRCREFNTCSELSDNRQGSSLSRVNLEAFQLFEEGQHNLLHNRCQASGSIKERIVTLMTIPLIQATLRYAHMIAHEDHFDESHGAQASLFALTILPLVHDCSPKDALLLHNNLQPKDTGATVDFAAVKEALENAYQCLNLQCSEIGGIWDLEVGTYKPDAHPCGGDETSNLVAAAVGGSIGVALFLAALGLWSCRRRQFVENAALGRRDSDLYPDDEVFHQDVPRRISTKKYYSNQLKMVKTRTSERLRKMLYHNTD